MALPTARLQWLPILLECSRSGGFVSQEEQETFGRKVLSNFPPGSYSSTDLDRSARDSSKLGTLELRYVEIQQKAFRQMANASPPLVLSRGSDDSWSLTREGREYLEEWLSQQLPTTVSVQQAVASEKRLWELVPNWLSSQRSSLTPELSGAERRLWVVGEVLRRATKRLFHQHEAAQPERELLSTPTCYVSIDSLGLGAIAWPHLRGQQRQNTLSIGDGVTLQQATDYLHGESSHHDLVSVFGTEKRKRDLANAIDSFRGTADQWAAGRSRDARLNWLLPESLVDEHNRVDEDWIKRLDDPWLSRFERCEGASAWLPLLSMEGVSVLSRLNSADYAFLSTALGKASLQIGGEGVLKPWRPTFRTELGMLPIGYVFQADATNKLDKILQRLMQAGCRNIGHLVILEPNAWQLSRDVSTSEWGKLKLDLEELA